MTTDKGTDTPPINKGRRTFLVALTSLLGAIGALFAAFPFVSSWFPSARARAAGGPVDVDISRLELGEMMTVAWRGKPVWIIRRSKEIIAKLQTTNPRLRDPDSLVNQQPDYANNPHRSINPEYLILIGICTHLGCAPTYKPNAGELGPDWPGGFYCPCHGSTFDLSGRVFKGVPAPINLQVPPYRFVTSKKIVIGEDVQNA